MKLELCNAKISVFQPENINDKCIVNVFTGRIGGLKSELVTISVEPDNVGDAKNEGWVSFDLNRNTAKYLINFLQSYINEKEIDIDAED